MDFDIPEAEELACALEVLETRLARQGQYDQAVDVSMSAKRMRMDSEEIAALERRVGELEADRQRLESVCDNGWIVRHGRQLVGFKWEYQIVDSESLDVVASGKDYRSAIDAAMTAGVK